MVAAVALSGCVSRVGSRSLPKVRRSYNEALSESADEQMLLNVVRLRYLHSPVFLQLSNVVTQYSLTSNGGLNGGYNPGAAPPFPLANVGASAGISVTERPTITYTPLHGEEFVRQLATPITAEQIVLLVRAGWGWDLVLTTCVQNINGIEAPWLPREEEDGRFQRLAILLRDLQWRREVDVEDGSPGEGTKLVLVFRRDANGKLSADAREALDLLGLAPDMEGYPVAPDTAHPLPGTLTLRGKSVLSAMFQLSMGVETPPGDKAARPLPGTPSDPRLRVKSAKREPSHAYVKVRYRERWFYIDEEDFESKRAFVLLTFLFAFTSAPVHHGPVLTVGASGP